MTIILRELSHNYWFDIREPIEIEDENKINKILGIVRK